MRGGGWGWGWGRRVASSAGGVEKRPDTNFYPLVGISEACMRFKSIERTPPGTNRIAFFSIKLL